MKTLLIISSMAMIAFTLICGFWIRGQVKVERSSIDFHMWLALVTIAIVVSTIFYLAKR